MGMAVIRVGVRGLRQDLARYLESESPVAITRHGQTVGYYVPTRVPRDEKESDTLPPMVERLEAILNQHGVSAEEIVAEFRARRTPPSTRS